MKLERFFSYIFAGLGVVLLIVSFGVCLLSRNAPVRMTEVPAGAEQCAEAFCDAVNNGELVNMSRMIYGQPDLGMENLPEAPEATLVWQAFADSISCEFDGGYYPMDAGIAREVKITTMDVVALMENLAQHAQTVLEEKVAAAGTLADIYDENNNYREDLVELVMQEALQRVLAQDVKTVTWNVTLNLINRDDSWWIVPDQSLLQAISGVA